MGRRSASIVYDNTTFVPTHLPCVSVFFRKLAELKPHAQVIAALGAGGFSFFMLLWSMSKVLTVTISIIGWTTVMVRMADGNVTDEQWARLTAQFLRASTFMRSEHGKIILVPLCALAAMLALRLLFMTILFCPLLLIRSIVFLLWLHYAVAKAFGYAIHLSFVLALPNHLYVTLGLAITATALIREEQHRCTR